MIGMENPFTIMLSGLGGDEAATRRGVAHYYRQLLNDKRYKLLFKEFSDTSGKKLSNILHLIKFIIRNKLSMGLILVTLVQGMPMILRPEILMVMVAWN
jgi:hypothetical protein